MRYKVGDKVRIREDLVTGGNYGGSVAVDDMTDMGGSVVTIESVGSIGYYIEEDPDGYCWTDEMFEPVEEMSVEEAIEILAEICMKQYTCSECPIQCIDRKKHALVLEEKIQQRWLRFLNSGKQTMRKNRLRLNLLTLSE